MHKCGRHKPDSPESIKVRYRDSPIILLYEERRILWVSQARQPSVHRHDKQRPCLKDEGEDWCPRLICCLDSWAIAHVYHHRNIYTCVENQICTVYKLMHIYKDLFLFYIEYISQLLWRAGGKPLFSIISEYLLFFMIDTFYFSWGSWSL